MLRVCDLTSGYGAIEAVRALSFSVDRGEIAVLVGPNGAGKSTTIGTIAGLVTATAGTVVMNGTDITRERLDLRVKAGIALVPEGRRVFAELSVAENLAVGAHHLPTRAMDNNLERVLSLFPRLRERARQMAGSLSGGEQQMLALGRAIMASPQLMLVDELSLGLMPRVVDECYAALATLVADGMAIVLVEQNTERALAVANHVIALESGTVTWAGTGAAAREQSERFDSHLAPQ